MLYRFAQYYQKGGRKVAITSLLGYNKFIDTSGRCELDDDDVPERAAVILFVNALQVYKVMMNDPICDTKAYNRSTGAMRRALQENLHVR